MKGLIHLKILKKISEILFTIWAAFSYIIYVVIYGDFVLLVSFIIQVFKGKKAAVIYVKKQIHYFCKATFLATFTKVTVEGKGNVPEKGPFVIASNHQSYLDIPAAGCYVFWDLTFIAKKELSKLPPISWFIKRSGGVFIDRGNRAQTAGALRDLIKKLRNGSVMLIFPEGTRSIDGTSMGEFKKDSLGLPYKMKIPVLPVSIDGTGKFFGKGAKSFKPSSVKIFIDKPVYSENYDNLSDFSDYIEESIKNNLEDLRR